MPEIAEVEAQVQKLRAWSAGRVVERLELVDARALREGASGLPRLQGARVEDVRRRAKYLWWALAGGWSLMNHLRMTGEWRETPPGGASTGRVRARLRWAGGGAVQFTDPRALGELWLIAPGGLEGFFGARSLGPEPWPGAKPGAWWAAQLTKLRGPIKPALLRQDRISGLGNIAAVEILWRAGISPHRPVPRLSTSEWSAIAAATPIHLDLALADAMRDDFSYLSASPRTHNPFQVYKRAGSACPRCQTKIARFKQSGRSTFWCPGCQV